jgi:hypothetical protein
MNLIVFHDCLHEEINNTLIALEINETLCSDNICLYIILKMFGLKSG